MKMKQWMTMAILLAVGGIPSWAAWDAEPERAEGTLARVTAYTDRVVFVVRGTGYYANGRVVESGRFDYWIDRPRGDRLSPGDEVRVMAANRDVGRWRAATSVQVVSDVSTGGVQVVESSWESARERARHRHAMESFLPTAAVVLPLLILFVLAIGLTARCLLARCFAGWDRRFFPRRRRPYLILASIAIPIAAAVGWRLYAYLFYLVNYGLA